MSTLALLALILIPLALLLDQLKGWVRQVEQEQFNRTRKP